MKEMRKRGKGRTGTTLSPAIKLVLVAHTAVSPTTSVAQLVTVTVAVVVAVEPGAEVLGSGKGEVERHKGTRCQLRSPPKEPGRRTMYSVVYSLVL
jgi:hypothetical protein